MDSLDEKILQIYENTVVNPKEEDLIEQYLSLLDKIEEVGSQLDEKWPGKVEIKQTGEYSGKSVEELRKQLKAMKGKKPFPREKYSEVMFAIRAKTGWKKGAGAVGESFINEKGRGTQAKPMSVWRKDIENSSDDKLLAFWKKQKKNQTVDANVWNMLIDELEKRKLKK